MFSGTFNGDHMLSIELTFIIYESKLKPKRGTTDMRVNSNFNSMACMGNIFLSLFF